MSKTLEDKKKNGEWQRATFGDQLTVFTSSSKARKRYLTHGIKFWFFIFVLQVLIIVPISAIIWLLTLNYGYIIWVAIFGIVLAFITYLGLRLSQKPFSLILQSTCFYYSVSAAKSLEKGKFVEGGFYVDKLISFINQYCKTKNAKIENFEVKVKKLFHDKIESLCDHRQEVVEAVRQSGKDGKSFADHLNNLARSLFSDSVNLKESSCSLSFLVDNCQDYFQEGSFLMKHKSINLSFKGLYDLLPVLVPIITTVLAAILPIIIHH